MQLIILSMVFSYYYELNFAFRWRRRSLVEETVLSAETLGKFEPSRYCCRELWLEGKPMVGESFALVLDKFFIPCNDSGTFCRVSAPWNLSMWKARIIQSFPICFSITQKQTFLILKLVSYLPIPWSHGFENMHWIPLLICSSNDWRTEIPEKASRPSWSCILKGTNALASCSRRLCWLSCHQHWSHTSNIPWN